MMWGLMLGLGASLGWGVSSFLAGQQARQLAPLLVTLWSQIAGGLALFAVLLLSDVTASPAGLG